MSEAATRFDPPPHRRTLRGWLYTTMQSLRGFPLDAFARELAAAEALPQAEFDRQHAEQLTAALEHARAHVPLYRTRGWVGAQAPRVAGLDTWPVLEREIVRARLDELRSQTRGRAVTRHTSGSTGVNLKVKLSPHAEAWGWAHRYRGLLWHGLPIGVPSLRLSHHLRPFRDFLLDQHCVPNLDSPEAVENAVRYLTETRPPLVTGPPSTLFYLARCLAERGVKAPLAPYARVGGEQLFGFQRSAIERHLCARVLNSYGCTEIGAVAGECEAGSLHIYADHVHVETFDGSSPASPGEIGDIVLTSLRNPAMPLVRYRVGDRGRLALEPCRCGLPLPVLTDLQARGADTFLSADGRRRHGSELVSQLDAFFADPVSTGVRQAQFEQIGALAWRVWVEVHDDRVMGGALDARMAGLVREIAGEDCSVEVHAARTLPRVRGKFYYYRLAPTN